MSGQGEGRGEGRVEGTGESRGVLFVWAVNESTVYEWPAFGYAVANAYQDIFKKQHVLCHLHHLLCMCSLVPCFCLSSLSKGCHWARR